MNDTMVLPMPLLIIGVLFGLAFWFVIARLIFHGVLSTIRRLTRSKSITDGEGEGESVVRFHDGFD